MGATDRDRAAAEAVYCDLNHDHPDQLVAADHKEIVRWAEAIAQARAEERTEILCDIQRISLDCAEAPRTTDTEGLLLRTASAAAQGVCDRIEDVIRARGGGSDAE